MRPKVDGNSYMLHRIAAIVKVAKLIVNGLNKHYLVGWLSKFMSKLMYQTLPLLQLHFTSSKQASP